MLTMKFLGTFLATALCLVVSPSVLAQSEVPSFATELERHRTTVTLVNDELGGAGARLLLESARASQFVLVGEDHGFAEIPQFTAALFRLIAPAGYRHLVIEAGPIAGRNLSQRAAGSAPQRSFAELNRKYPFAVPFFGWREETEMLEAVVRTAQGVAEPLWALDHEFALSAPLHFDRLVELAPDASARAVAMEYRDRVQTEFARVVETKNPSLAFMLSATAEDFMRLDAAFKARAASEAGRILRELRVGWEIYQKNSQGQGYASNLQRSELMKAHFRDYYDRARAPGRAPPKALFKFGAYHVKRGRSVTDVFDIGNLASELAVMNGSHSFHLLVIAAGTHNAFLPFVGVVADKQKPYDPIEAFSFMDVKPLLAAAGREGWTLLDLRPLRPLLAAGSLGKIERGLEEAIFGYDAVLVMPKARAATLFE